VNDRFRKQVFNGCFQDVLPRETMDGKLGRNCRSKFDKYMVQKRHAALNRGRHAHLILLHQQFNKVSLYIRIQQPVQEIARGMLPVLH